MNDRRKRRKRKQPWNGLKRQVPVREAAKRAPRPGSPEETARQILSTLPISAWPWPRIVAFVPQFPALPHADDVFFHFWMIARQGLPIMKISYGRTDLVRNRAALLLLQSDFTHVLMLDADHQHPAHITQMLARWVLEDPARLVVGGLNFRRGEPFDPCAFLRGADGLLYPPTEWQRGLIEVDAIGTGSLLISRKVFERIEPPWFVNDYSRVWEDRWPGEDIGFSKKCNAANIKLYVDTTLTSPHMIDGFVDESSYRAYLEDNQHRAIPVEEFKRQREDAAALALGAREVEAL